MCDFGDEGAIELAKAIERNKNLTNLSISHNKISNQGAIAISNAIKNSKITWLVLCFNDLRDIGACAIADSLNCNAQIRELYLGGNKIGVQGFIALAKAIKYNKTITKLDLGCNLQFYQDENEDGIEKDNVGILAIADVMQHNKVLEDVNLISSCIEDEGAIALAFAITSSTSLIRIDLDYNQIGDDGALALACAMKESKCATFMSLCGNADISDFGMSCLIDISTRISSCKKIDLDQDSDYMEEYDAVDDIY